jgi:myosin tail region-interacting protein MTI1
LPGILSCGLQFYLHPASQGLGAAIPSSKIWLAIMSKVPFKVKAIYEYSSPHDDDLSFPYGQIITVTAEEDDDWYAGDFVDSTGGEHQGIFPRNFVERYEPEVPSRPARPKRAKKENELATPAPAPAQISPKESVTATQEGETSPERPVEKSSAPPGNSASPASAQPATRPLSSTTAVKASQQPPPNSTSKDMPAEAPDKPSGGSFKDRIAAFNKPAASPVAPFKPGGQGSSSSTGFIKKPFVAPPPSKNSYIPPPREPPPTKLYRREEDPGLNETAEDSEASMPLPGEKVEACEEERSKPTSLKDRIALLQKQQLEQAARHAEAAQKKEKPKRPPKRRTGSQECMEPLEAPAEADLEPVDTSDTVGKKSVDFADDESEPLGGQGGHQPSSAVPMSTPPQPSRELMSDTNDADYSAAGDTEEAYDTSTSREDDRERGLGAQTAMRKEEPVTVGVAVEKSDEELEEEQDMDPEIKRRMEIRERMAKMSGGMGLMGMFGPPGGIPAPSKRSQPSADVERDVTSGTAETFPRAPPIPVPGMSNAKGPARNAGCEEDSSADEAVRKGPSRQQEAEAEYSDDESTEPPRPPPRASMDRAPPPVPQGTKPPSAPVWPWSMN